MNWLRIIGVTFLLSIIGGLGIYAFVLLQKNQSRENYFFMGFVSLMFVVVFMTTVLGYKFSGTHLGIESAKQEIEASKNEVTKVANTLIKIAYILADGSGRFGGIPDVHLKKIEEYRKEIEEYLDKNIDKEVRNSIDELNKKIEERNKKSR